MVLGCTTHLFDALFTHLPSFAGHCFPSWGYPLPTPVPGQWCVVLLLALLWLGSPSVTHLSPVLGAARPVPVGTGVLRD